MNKSSIKSILLTGLLFVFAFSTLEASTIKSDGVPEDTIPSIRTSTLPAVPMAQQVPANNGPDGTVIEHAEIGPFFLNAFEMIQGRVAGVQVTGANFYYKVRVRGALRPPLLVINDTPFYNYDDAMINDLVNSIPVNDIDYITVYKNIANTMRYGFGAGNGVIMIRTKQGEIE